MADIILPGEPAEGPLGADRLPESVDLVWWKGDMQEYIFAFTDNASTPQPLNLTGYTPSAVIRASFNNPTSYNFACTVQNTNQVRIYLSSPVSKTIPAGDYVWNLQLTAPNGDVRTYLAGDVTVHAEVDG